MNVAAEALRIFFRQLDFAFLALLPVLLERCLEDEGVGTDTLPWMRKDCSSLPTSTQTTEPPKLKERYSQPWTTAFVGYRFDLLDHFICIHSPGHGHCCHGIRVIDVVHMDENSEQERCQ